MANPDHIFMDGFDHYGPIPDSTVNIINGSWAQAWNNQGIGLSQVRPIDPLTGGLGSGIQLIRNTGANGVAWAQTNFPANYARCVGGLTFKHNTITYNYGIAFGDNTTAQLAISISSIDNTISVMRGHLNGTVLATSTETLINNSIHCLEWDITINSTTGSCKLWLDGSPMSIDFTATDTAATANNYFNSFMLGCNRPNNSGQPQFDLDHLYVYCYTSSGGSETPLLTNPLVLTDFPNSDDTSDFVASQTVFGTTAITTSANTGGLGANRSFLTKYTAPVNMTLNTIQFVPGTTSATAKFKAVVYSDNADSPDTLLDSGTEVVGSVSGTTLSLPLTTPEALTGGTAYWIGFITDTSIAAARSSGSGTTLNPSTYWKASTYASGALSPAGSGWAIIDQIRMWGLCTSAASNYPAVDDPNPSTLNANVSAIVGDKDYFGFPNLAINPNAIYAVSLKVSFSKSDGGARTAKINVKSGSTETSGSAGTITPALSQQYYESSFIIDPDTGVEWTQSGLNAAKGGYEIDT